MILTCLAPWDTVLDDADNRPGGEQYPAFVESVASDCGDAGRSRFAVAPLVLLLGLALCGVGRVVAARTDRTP